MLRNLHNTQGGWEKQHGDPGSKPKRFKKGLGIKKKQGGSGVPGTKKLFQLKQRRGGRGHEKNEPGAPKDTGKGSFKE